MALLSAASPARSQAINVKAGAGDLFGVDGGQITVYSPGYTTIFGGGLSYGHVYYGAAISTETRFGAVVLGDSVTAFGLPTDQYTNASTFYARGVKLTRGTVKSSSHLMVFLGETSIGFSTLLFSAQQPKTLAAIVFYDRDLGDRFRWVSRNVLTTRSTSIQEVEYTGFKDVKLAGGGGFGSNAPYASASIAITKKKMHLFASETVEGKRFRLINLVQPGTLAQASYGPVVNILVLPVDGLGLNASHQSYLYAPHDSPAEPITVNSGGASYVYKTVILSASANDSTGIVKTSGESFSATERFGAVSVSEAYYRAETSLLMLTGTEKMRKFAISEFVSRQRGQTSVNFGGSYTGNRWSVSAGYNVQYVPIYATNPWQKVFNVTVNVKVADASISTALMENRVIGTQYEVYGSRFFYGPYEHSNTVSQSQKSLHARYVVRGVVTDAAGNPVEGAAIRVGKVEVYSNGRGEFLVRSTSKKPAVIEIVPEDFLAVGTWKRMQPISVTPAEEGSAPAIVVIQR